MRVIVVCGEEPKSQRSFLDVQHSNQCPDFALLGLVFEPTCIVGVQMVSISCTSTAVDQQFEKKHCLTCEQQTRLTFCYTNSDHDHKIRKSLSSSDMFQACVKTVYEVRCTPQESTCKQHSMIHTQHGLQVNIGHNAHT